MLCFVKFVVCYVKKSESIKRPAAIVTVSHVSNKKQMMIMTMDGRWKRRQFFTSSKIFFWCVPFINFNISEWKRRFCYNIIIRLGQSMVVVNMPKISKSFSIFFCLSVDFKIDSFQTIHLPYRDFLLQRVIVALY